MLESVVWHNHVHRIFFFSFLLDQYSLVFPNALTRCFTKQVWFSDVSSRDSPLGRILGQLAYLATTPQQYKPSWLWLEPGVVGTSTLGDQATERDISFKWKHSFFSEFSHYPGRYSLQATVEKEFFLLPLPSPSPCTNARSTPLYFCCLHLVFRTFPLINLIRL